MNELETLAKIDSDDRSLRLERSQYSTPNGPRTSLLITTYRKVMGGKWCRVSSVTVRRNELADLVAMLEALTRKEPAVGR